MLYLKKGESLMLENKLSVEDLVKREYPEKRI